MNDSSGGGGLSDQKIAQIDAAIARAKARKSSKDGEGGGTPPAAGAPKPSDGERALAKEQRDAERKAKQAERAKKKEERLAAAVARATAPAHMRKVMRAAEKLSPLGAAAALLFAESTKSLSPGDLAALAQHILHHNRVQATSSSLSAKLSVGQAVTIIGGEPRYVGITGTILKAQRIRCYVQVPNQSKPVYLFTSDVQPVEGEEPISEPEGTTDEKSTDDDSSESDDAGEPDAPSVDDDDAPAADEPAHAGA